MIRGMMRTIAWAVAAIALWSCGGDEPAAQMVLADIVTFEGYRSERPVFTMRKEGDSPLITLTGHSGRLSQDLEDGQRVLLRYLPANGEAYSSGDVAVRSVVRINYDKLRKGPLDGWDADPVYMLALWRTGQYLNLECTVEYSDESRRFFLLVDEPTIADPVPQLYLMHDMGDAPANFSRHIYASWDMSALWNTDGCLGVTVNINDSNRGIRRMTFMKQ